MSEVTDTPSEIPTPAAQPTEAAPSPVDAPKPPPPPAAKSKAEPAAQADKPAAKATDPDPVAHMLKALQADNATLASDLKAASKRAEAAEREAAKHAAAVDALTKRVNQDAIVGRMRDKLPHAAEIDIRGALAALHEAGKVDRYSDKADDAATLAVEALKAGGSILGRAPAPTGGPGGAPPQATAARVKRPPI